MSAAGLGGEVTDGLLARRAVQAVDLHPLDPAQSEEMVRECLSATAISAGVAHAVVSRSDGVPFFIEELLATALGHDNSECVPLSIGAAIEAYSPRATRGLLT